MQRQVDAAGRELLEHLEERIRGGRAAARRSARSCRPRSARAARRAGRPARTASRPARCRRCPRPARRRRGASRCRGRRSRLCAGSVPSSTPMARGDVAGRGHMRVRGHVRAEPAVALRVGDRVGRDDLTRRSSVVPRGATSTKFTGTRYSPMIRRPGSVARASWVVETPPSIEFSIAIIAASTAALEHVGERLADVVHGRQSWPRASATCVECRLREGSGGPEIAVGAAFSHAFHLSPRRLATGFGSHGGCARADPGAD